MSVRFTGLFGLLAVLSACTQPAAVPASPASAGRMLSRPDVRSSTPPRASWIRRDLQNQPLLYVTNPNTVTIYSGLGGSSLTLVGEIFGFQGPIGACADAQGDVFVVDGPARAVDEFAYGSVVPKSVLTDGLGEPYACAIDPGSGRLAVTNLTNATGGEPGNVLVYAPPSGSPAEYSDPQANEPLFCTFDRKGNLIVDAYDGAFDPVIARLASAGTKLKTLTMAGLDPRKAYGPSGLESDGSVMLWGDNVNVDIDQLKIAGSTATLVATQPLGNLYSIGQFVTYGSKASEVVIIPDYSGSRLQTYSYPQGTLLFTTTDGINLPGAAVISKP